MDEKLPPHQQRQLEQNIVNGQARQNMELMLHLTSGCFEQCVHYFPSKVLDKDETGCIEHCTERFIELSQRVGKVYQAHQANVVQHEKLKKEKESASR
mmetsp:Transcript_9432/g.14129  ORF Transcript_9432/g.14129 Transcript_9432/m.14129 type:complete len:98 (-) Transcript_9432:286-579(-)